MHKRTQHKRRWTWLLVIPAAYGGYRSTDAAKATDTDGVQRGRADPASADETAISRDGVGATQVPQVRLLDVKRALVTELAAPESRRAEHAGTRYRWSRDEEIGALDAREEYNATLLGVGDGADDRARAPSEADEEAEAWATSETTPQARFSEPL